MAAESIFISHTTDDDAIVAEIRKNLEAHGYPVWTDSRSLAGGDLLEPEILRNVEQARHFMVVLSPAVINSEWVSDEIKHALKVQKKRSDGYKVIPILLPGVKPAALRLWFGKKPLAITLSTEPGGVEAAMPDLLAALGERQPNDTQTARVAPAPPVADLILELTDPTMHEAEGMRRAAATATLTYQPADYPNARRVESLPYRFVAPLGPIEAGEIDWYLERYAQWPFGIFRERAERVEKQLPVWGKLLYDVLLDTEARAAFEAWNALGRDVPRRFTLLVNSALKKGSSKKAKASADEAATKLLSLPWELLHDGKGYLLHGARRVPIRRSLPNREVQESLLTAAPIRVLLVSPRPEDDTAPYLDHRISAKPLVEALAGLGDLAELTILSPPTFPALEKALQEATDSVQPYHVVHFDGHGVYDPHVGLGALCFEAPADAHRLTERRSALVDAEQIAAIARGHRVPLFFLEACQTAKTEKDPTASVAGRLLQGGVASVAAMSHSILVETARRFVSEFYKSLVEGERVSRAMLTGRTALKGDPKRGRIHKDDLELQDWFVPILYQEELDPPLIAAVPAARVQTELRKARERALGALPDEPPHTFVGRSRELLAVERLLAEHAYALIRGEGGEGKTTLAAEAARWLVATRRFERAAFVAFDKIGDSRAALWSLGDQLVPGFLTTVGADEKLAWQHVERALEDHPTVLVLDNLESVLPPPEGGPPNPPILGGDIGTFEPEGLAAILALCRNLIKTGETRLLFTSREAMPAPFDRNVIAIGRLDRRDAIALVGQALGEGAWMPGAKDAGESEEAVEALVEAVGCHARSLVLLAQEVRAKGVRRATESLHELMTDLHKQYPNDRERSLFASVELSLRRLPPGVRERIRPLGAFQGGGSLVAIAAVLGLDTEKDEEVALAKQLIDVGLAEWLPPSYLRFDPALAPLLWAEMSETEREAARAAWSETMRQVASGLYQLVSTNPNTAYGLAGWEMPNLLAALEGRAATADPEDTIWFAVSVENLAQTLGRRHAKERAGRVLAEAERRLGEWSHARYLAESTAIDRLHEEGRFAEAVQMARRLLARCAEVGDDAYPAAAYDHASTHFRLGRALQMGGAAETALAPLDEARRRLTALAQAGDTDADRMAAVTLGERAICLWSLGRLDEAATAFEEVIALAERLGNPRSAAVNRGQLGSVRLYQRRYADALAAHEMTRVTFEQLGDTASVAVAWHQIGMVYREVGDYPSAERAYLESLKIEVQMGNRSGEAATLHQLGSLYDDMGRLEEAVRLYNDAAAFYAKLRDGAHEGVVRNNAAISLLRLRRYDEARRELERAIECKELFGHAAEPWKTFNLLHNLELAVGNEAAAEAARQRAIATYLAYRRDGGDSPTTGAQLVALVAQALAERQPEPAAAQLAALLQESDLPDTLRALIPALLQVLAGLRDPALAADPALNYADAAELTLLLAHPAKHSV